MAGQSASAERESVRPRRLDLLVVDRRPAGRNFTRLVLEAPPDWQSLPGQFVTILCESDMAAVRASEGRVLDYTDGGERPQATGLELGRRWPVVRRPMSISRVIRHGGRTRIEILVRAIGAGTRFLSARPVGTLLSVVGPLGNAFTPPEDDRLCILVGGGCGMAPLFGLADDLADRGRRVKCFLGANTVVDMPLVFRSPPAPTHDRIVTTDAAAEFASPRAAVVLATDDGTAGFHGTATAAVMRYLDEEQGAPVILYGCGPTPMLRALTEVAAAHGAPCQISLEGFMGCGIGVCLSCARKRRDPTSDKGWTYRLTCREGPVVDGQEILWDDP